MAWGKNYEEREGKEEECVFSLLELRLFSALTVLRALPFLPPLTILAFRLFYPPQLNSDPLLPSEITLLAAYAASTLTRSASKLTFAQHRRAMQTGEMLGFVGKAFEEVFGREEVVDEAEGGAEGVLAKLTNAIKGSL